MTRYGGQIKVLSDDRRESYRQIIEMSTEPQDVGLLKPEARYEATKANDNGKIKMLPVWDSHLLCNEDGKYPAELNDWERTVVETESARPGFSCKRMGNYIPLPTSSTNFFKNSVGAVGL